MQLNILMKTKAPRETAFFKGPLQERKQDEHSRNFSLLPR